MKLTNVGSLSTLISFYWRGNEKKNKKAHGDNSFIMGIIHLLRSQNFQKNQHFLPLISTPTCQVVGNVSFSKKFANIGNEWSHA